MLYLYPCQHHTQLNPKRKTNFLPPHLYYLQIYTYFSANIEFNSIQFDIYTRCIFWRGRWWRWSENRRAIRMRWQRGSWRRGTRSLRGSWGRASRGRNRWGASFRERGRGCAWQRMPRRDSAPSSVSSRRKPFTRRVTTTPASSPSWTSSHAPRPSSTKPGHPPHDIYLWKWNLVIKFCMCSKESILFSLDVYDYVEYDDWSMIHISVDCIESLFDLFVTLYNNWE